MPAFEAETYLRLAAELSKRGIGFTLFSDQTRWVEDITIPATFLREFRSAFQGSVVLTGGYLKEGKGRVALSASLSALVSWPLIFINGETAKLPVGTPMQVYRS